MIPLNHSWTYIQRSVINIEERYLHTHAYCSSIHSNNTGNRQGTQQLMNVNIKYGYIKIKCGYMYVNTMEYCSAIKKNEIFSFAGKCIELESIIVR
jgi:hypothetical protein